MFSEAAERVGKYAVNKLRSEVAGMVGKHDVNKMKTEISMKVAEVNKRSKNASEGERWKAVSKRRGVDELNSR